MAIILALQTNIRSATNHAQKKRARSDPDLIKETVDVDVHAVTRGRLQQYVLSVPITQTEDVARYAHHSRRATVGDARVVP